VTIIETRELTKAYPGHTAVVDLSLEIKAGEIYGLLGPNGAGKTTTIRLLAALLRPSRGQARVAGHDLRAERDAVRSVVGLLPESTGFYGWMTPVEYLRFFADLYGMPRAEAFPRIDKLLECVGLVGRRSSAITTLSRGLRVRLGIARALVHRPRVLFLDEPTLGLDPMGQRDLLRLIQTVNADEGATVVLSSHALDQVGQVCARVGILTEGRLVAQGTAVDLCQQLQLRPTLDVSVADTALAQRIATEVGLYATATVAEPGRLLVTGKNADPRPEPLVRALIHAGTDVREVRVRTPSLEDVFFAVARPARRPPCPPA
jgi:ABC-2 type transport system ATP-binding protein